MCIQNDLHEIITYILSLCLPSVRHDLQLQQKIYMEIEKKEEEDDPIMSYDNFRNKCKFK